MNEFDLVVKQAEAYYTKLADNLIADGWGAVIVNRVKTTYLNDINARIESTKISMDSEFCDETKVKEIIEDLKVFDNEVAFKTRVSHEMERFEHEEEIRLRSMELDKKRTEQMRKEESSSLANKTKVESWLQEKNIRSVDPEELADTLFDTLTEEKKNYYFFNPMYAAASFVNTKPLETALDTCLQRVHKSVVIKRKINEYLDVVNPKRDTDEYEINKLIDLLPENRKTSDSREFQAYTAICWLEDKEREAPEVTPEDIKQVEPEFIGDVAANVLADEPYSVSYRSGIENVIGKTFEKYGSIKAVPKRLSDVARRATREGERGTLGDELYERVKRDEEVARVVSEKKEEREKYEEKIAELEKKLNKSQQQQPNRGYGYQQNGYGYGYQQNGYGYQQNRYGYGYRQNSYGMGYGRQTNPFIGKLIASLVLILVGLIASLITKTFVSLIGAVSMVVGLLTFGNGRKYPITCIIVGVIILIAGFML